MNSYSLLPLYSGAISGWISEGSVEGAAVAPLFQIMGAVDVPVNVIVGLVLIQAVLYAQRNLVHRIGEAEVRRRVVHRIAAHDDQHVHLAGVHVADEFFQRGRLNLRLHLHGVGVDDGIADRTQRRIHGVRQGVNRRRLIVAGNHDRRALVGLKIFHQRRDKLLLLGLGSFAATDAQSGSDGARHRLHFRRTHRQAMVGLAAGIGRRALAPQ